MNQDFNSICAYEDGDLHEALCRIAHEDSFLRLLPSVGKMVGDAQFDVKKITDLLEHVRTIDEFDNAVVLPLVGKIQQLTTASLVLTGLENTDINHPALFLTNHRDIILDSAFLSYIYKQHTGERIYIGIGTNLYAQPWIEDFVRANKAFSVIRGGNPRQILAHSSLLSKYILYVITRLHHSVWLAQREGRAKDGNDRTQPAVLKMLTMAGEGTLQERLERLNITPVSLSYEYDPCDFLKAREMQIKRDNNGVYEKTKADDLLSMKTGLLGWKGNVAFHITPSVNAELATVVNGSDVRNKQIENVAHLIDKHIHSHYHIFNTNRIAYDAFLHTGRFAGEYTMEEQNAFMQYVNRQIQRITGLPRPDEAFLRERILEMYANPLINHLEQLPEAQ